MNKKLRILKEKLQKEAEEHDVECKRQQELNSLYSYQEEEDPEDDFTTIFNSAVLLPRGIIKRPILNQMMVGCLKLDRIK